MAHSVQCILVDENIYSIKLDIINKILNDPLSIIDYLGLSQIDCNEKFKKNFVQEYWGINFAPSFCQAFLLNEDLGDSLDSVEALLKKHEDFEKSLSAQEEKITVSPTPMYHSVFLVD